MSVPTPKTFLSSIAFQVELSGKPLRHLLLQKSFTNEIAIVKICGDVENRHPRKSSNTASSIAT